MCQRAKNTRQIEYHKQHEATFVLQIVEWPFITSKHRVLYSHILDTL